MNASTTTNRGLDTADLDLGTPVPTPDTVYVGSSYGLHGLDPEDGTERWRLVLGNEPNHISNGQTVGSDAVYVADAMGSTLYPVVADAQLPGLDVNAFIRDAPGLVGGRLTLTLERETAPIWSVPESRLPSTLASARNDDGTIAFTSIDIDGAWTFTRPDADHLTDRTGMTTAAADGERIYVTETARRPTTVVASVIGIDATTGRQVWHRDTPIADVSGSVDVEMGQRITAAIVGDNGVYVALTTNADYETAGQVLRPTANEVRRLAPEDGTVRWAVSVPFPPRGLTLAADRLYVWDGNGRLAAVR